MDEAESCRGSVPLLNPNIQNVHTYVYNRVAATKPLNYMFRLLALTPTMANQLASEAKKAIDDPDSTGVAFVHVATAFQPEAFGLRVGMHVSDEEHLLAVDVALEYEWIEPVFYERSSFELFIDRVAAPRGAAAAWTILEEVARSVGASLPTKLVIPPEHIANFAMQQFDKKHPDEQGSAAEKKAVGTGDHH